MVQRLLPKPCKFGYSRLLRSLTIRCPRPREDVMLHWFVAVALTGSIQDAKPKVDIRTAEMDDIPGFPDGEAPKIPARVRWALDQNVLLAKTRLRARYNLGALWRFQPVPARDTPVVRAQMGWLEMPAVWSDGNAAVYDTNFRATDGLWRNRPLADLDWAWVEREIPTPAEWLTRRIFLYVAGPWEQAEVYVNAEPLGGEAWLGGMRFELTSALIYPGDSLLDLRMGPAKTGRSEKNLRSIPEPAAAPVAPRIELELTPTGPRIDSVRVRFEPLVQELAVDLDVVRPAGWPVVGPKTTELQFAIDVQFLDEADAVVSTRRESASLVDQPAQTVCLRLSTVVAGRAVRRGKLTVRMVYDKGPVCDEPFPIAVDVMKLPAAQADAAQPAVEQPAASPSRSRRSPNS